MATRVRYCLAARSPFHIGDRGVGIEEASVVVHSDTIFSALCVILRELGENLDELLDRWPRLYMNGDKTSFLPGRGEPPFLLSSAFPYAGNVYLLPCPLIRLQGLDQVTDPSLTKQLKRLRYVSQPLFEAIIAGHSLANMLVEAEPTDKAKNRLRRDLLVQGGVACITPDEVAPLAAFAHPHSGQIRLWATDTAPRVTVDRVTNASQVYAAGRVAFPPGAGLAFFIAYNDIALRPTIEKALRALGDTGIGGERSSGYGQFSLHIAGPTDIAAPPPSPATGFTTLSLYWPTEAEVQAGVLDEASYSLINRRGWLGSPDAMNLRRRSVRMLAEGSVLRRRPLGALTDVKPLDPSPAANVPHDVWRYGIAFPVTCLMPSGRGG